MPVRPQQHNRPLAIAAKPQKQQANRQEGRALATNSAAWRRIRAYVLANEPLCRECAKAGKVVAASHVDHIDGNSGSNAQANLQPLCAPCHSRKTALEDGGFGNVQRIPSWVDKPACPVTLVCGPPGSGKSTYCDDRAGPDDLVIDLDIIKAAVSGQRIYESGDEWLAPAMRERNRIIASLAKRTKGRAWLIVGAPVGTERRKWQELLRADVVVLEADASLCEQRIKADERRSETAAKRHIRAALHWWHQYSMRQGETVIRSG